MDLPDHFSRERYVTGMELVASRGMESAADLKFAHWRGQFDSARTVPSSDFEVITILLNDTRVHRVDAPMETARKRTILHQPCNSSSSWTSDGPVVSVQIYLRAEVRENVARELGLETGGEDVEYLRDPRFSALFGQCISMLLADRHTSRLELDGWAQLLCAGLARGRDRSRSLPSIAKAKGSKEHRVKLALEIIEHGLDGDLSLSSLSAQCGISPWHFSRLFRDAVGKPPHQYVLERRLARAHELITVEPHLSLAALAQDTGFCSQQHLTTAFKKHFGVTPGDVRRSRR